MRNKEFKSILATLTALTTSSFILAQPEEDQSSEIFVGSQPIEMTTSEILEPAADAPNPSVEDPQSLGEVIRELESYSPSERNKISEDSMDLPLPVDI